MSQGRRKSVKNDQEMEVSGWSSGNGFGGVEASPHSTPVTKRGSRAKLVRQLKNDPHTPGGHPGIGKDTGSFLVHLPLLSEMTMSNLDVPTCVNVVIDEIPSRSRLCVDFFYDF